MSPTPLHEASSSYSHEGASTEPVSHIFSTPADAAHAIELDAVQATGLGTGSGWELGLEAEAMTLLANGRHDVWDALSPERSVAQRDVEGGTGPAAVRAQLDAARAALLPPPAPRSSNTAA